MSIEYTYAADPTPELHSQVLIKLNIAIDEIRGVFKNIGEEKGMGGLYPFEPLKTIRTEILLLDRAKVTPDQQKKARDNIKEEWKGLRSKFLLEFDRDFPTYPKSPYLILPRG